MPTTVVPPVMLTEGAAATAEVAKDMAENEASMAMLEEEDATMNAEFGQFLGAQATLIPLKWKLMKKKAEFAKLEQELTANGTADLQPLKDAIDGLDGSVKNAAVPTA